MDKAEFAALFRESLELAAKYAEERLGHEISRNFTIRLYGAGSSGGVFDPEEVINKIYIDQSRFYRIIDLSVVEISKGTTKVFVRVSQHSPGSFEETWNDPPGTGPFKQLFAHEIKMVNS